MFVRQLCTKVEERLYSLYIAQYESITKLRIPLDFHWILILRISWAQLVDVNIQRNQTRVCDSELQ